MMYYTPILGMLAVIIFLLDRMFKALQRNLEVQIEIARLLGKIEEKL